MMGGTTVVVWPPGQEVCVVTGSVPVPVHDEFDDEESVVVATVVTPEP